MERIKPLKAKGIRLKDKGEHMSLRNLKVSYVFLVLILNFFSFLYGRVSFLDFKYG